MNSRIIKAFIPCLGFMIFLHPLETRAQEPKASTSQSESESVKMCELRGTVVKSTTGVPLDRVEITLRPAGTEGREKSTASDSKGQFALPGIEPGLYFLDAQAAGFPSQRYSEGSIPRRRILSLKPGSDIADIVFRLVPGGVIVGTVYDEDGDPIVGAHVAALERFHGQVSAVVEGDTNDHGEYRLFWLAAGRYYVASSSLNESKTGVYPPTYFPNVSHLEDAAQVQVLPDGETAGVNIRSRRVRGVSVRGHVLIPVKGIPVQSAYVQLIPRITTVRGYFYEGRFSSAVDHKGSFEVRSVPPGTYILYGFFDQPERGYSGRLEITVDDTEVSDISLLLGPNLDLTARFRTGSGEKVDFSKLRVWLEPKENLLSPPMETQLRPDGAVVFRQVHLGNYILHVTGYPEGFYLKSARIGGVDVLMSGLNVEGSQSTETLDLELSPNAGHIDGTVLYELTPVPGAVVSLVPDPPRRERRDLYLQTATNSLGRFSFPGVAPGNFKLFAWEDADDSRINDPEFLRSFENLSTPVHIEEKQSTTVQLEVIPSLDSIDRRQSH